MSRALRLAREAQRLFRQADAENRPLSADERSYAQQLVDEAQEVGRAEKSIHDIGVALGSPGGAYPDPFADRGAAGGVGDAFVQSKGWQAIADPGTRPQQWSTGAIEVPPFRKGSSYRTKAGTLLEGVGAPGTGTGGGLIPVPEVIPGVVETLFEPLGVADVFAQGQTASNTCRYIVEGTAVSGASGVAEGGLKPASDLALSTTDEPVKKVATSLIVSDELFEDVTSVQSYLNSRFTLFVQREEERQILRGAGTNELVGVLNNARSINKYAAGTVDNNAVALAKVIANTRGSSWLEPDAIIMHPNNWLATRLLTDTAGQFFAGGPFQSQYGGGAPMVGVFGESLWGKRVVLSTYVGAGTALVGSFGQAARIMRRGGPTVEATNSHDNLFVYDLVAVRAETRAALCVFRPSAFTEVSGLD